MRTFIKVQATSLLASGIDFLTTIVCVEVVHIWYLAASVMGAIGGGIVSFGVSKSWVFSQNHQPIGPLLWRFALVWLGNAGLNATGLFMATQFLDVPYLMAKTAISILVGISYNYVFQKDFVFNLS
jgi:putative flippase GtrA